MTSDPTTAASSIRSAAISRHSSPAFAGPTWPRLEKGEYLIVPPHGWTCFHCGMTFTDFWAARGHFGTGHMKVKPMCIRIAEQSDRTRTEPNV